MSPRFTRSRFLAVGVLCAAGGVGAGAVATATASTSHSSQHSTTKAHHAHADHAGKGKGRRGFERDLLKVADHSASGTVNVRTKDGYRTITFEHGTVDSVSGDQLTITEGAGGKAASTTGLKQDTITVPSTAKIRDDRKTSSLSSLTAGQRVTVVQTPKRMIVAARTPKQHTAS